MYHINPKTGNPNVCRAHKRQCAFKLSESEHYATKEEALDGYEKTMNSETFQKPAKMPKRNEAKRLNDRQKEVILSLNRSTYIHREVKDGKVTWENRERLLEQEIAEGKEEARNIQSKLREHYAEWNPHRDIPPAEVEFTSGGFGLEQARYEVLSDMNDCPKFGVLQGDDTISDALITFDLENHIDTARNAYYASSGASDEQLSREELDSMHPSEALTALLRHENNSITSSSALYNVMVFPEKHLDPELRRIGVDHLSVSPLNNCREHGLIYTTTTPTGDTWSFSMYEHRNTDSIIINGKMNWDSVAEPFGPYAGDSKNSFFAEFHPDDKAAQARSLAFFLKEAQTGNLTTEEELTARCEHLDWKSIIGRTIPGFAEWVEKHEGKDESDDPRKG